MSVIQTLIRWFRKPTDVDGRLTRLEWSLRNQRMLSLTLLMLLGLMFWGTLRIQDMAQLTRYAGTRASDRATAAAVLIVNPHEENIPTGTGILVEWEAEVFLVT